MTTNKIGETNKASNGQLMTIIDYRNSYEVDIQFEDGTIVKNKSYQAFKKGSIKNPNYVKPSLNTKPSRKNLNISKIGETNIANNGQKMTIKEYFNASNITVEFEDGTIVKNKSYGSFKTGSIKNPNIKMNYNTTLNKMSNIRIGEKSMGSCGLMMEIIAYRSARDLDVRFEDGTIVQHVWYVRFQSGNVKHPIAGKDGIRLGATNINKEGRKMKISEYISSNNCTIEFEDGVTVKSYYKAFKDGIVKHPKDGSLRHVGEEVIAVNGQKMKLIEWHNNREVVEFEDGTQVTTSYRYFSEGKVGNPNYSLSFRCKQKRIGETSTSTNGQTITIIDYIKANDITVQFDDGTIKEHTNYNSFKKGTIHNPNLPLIKKRYSISSGTDRINETSKATNGQIMKIIDYRKSNDIDVEFEDGTIVKNKTYRDFINGSIKNPNISLSSYSKKYSK